MDHRETETATVFSNTNRSTFYCPRGPQLVWEVSDTISPWVVASLASIISPAAVLLNASVIIAVKKRKELQKLSNILLSSMAVTDLLIGGVCVPLSALDGFFLVYQILSEQNICKLDEVTSLSTFTLTFCSLFHLALVAWERYVAIRKWRDYRVIVTKGRLKKLAAIAWISATVFVWSPNLIVIAVGGDENNIVQQIMFTIPAVSILCILALIVYFYVMIYREVRKRKFNKIIPQVSQLMTMKMENRVAKTTALVTAALILSFVPVVSVAFLAEVFPILHKMSSWRIAEALVLSNSVVNPLIYCYRDCRFRNALLEILKIKKPQANNTRYVVRFTRRKDVRGAVRDNEQIQKVENLVRLKRSVSGNFPKMLELTPINSSETTLKRTVSAPMILLRNGVDY